MENVYLTRTALEKLRRNLEHLVKVERPEATAQLAAAREHGDLSENAEYDAAREKAADIDRRIAMIQQQLSRVHIIEKEDLTTGEVRILSSVTLLNTKTDSELTFTLVDPIQSDPDRNMISVKSPIGGGLLGRKVGDVVEISVPSGELKLKVLAIELSDVP